MVSLEGFIRNDGFMALEYFPAEGEDIGVGLVVLKRHVVASDSRFESDVRWLPVAWDDRRRLRWHELKRGEQVGFRHLLFDESSECQYRVAVEIRDFRGYETTIYGPIIERKDRSKAKTKHCHGQTRNLRCAQTDSGTTDRVVFLGLKVQ